MLIVRPSKRPERVLPTQRIPEGSGLWRIAGMNGKKPFSCELGDFIYTTARPVTPCAGKKKFVVAKIERDGKEQTVLVQIEFDEDGRLSPVSGSGLQGELFEIIGYFFGHFSTAGVPDPDPLELHAQ